MTTTNSIANQIFTETKFTTYFLLIISTRLELIANHVQQSLPRSL